MNINERLLEDSITLHSKQETGFQAILQSWRAFLRVLPRNTGADFWQ